MGGKAKQFLEYEGEESVEFQVIPYLA